MNCREMLDEIDDWLSDEYEDPDEKAAFIACLGAWRGPDKFDQDLKDETTAPIRGTMFPNSVEYLAEFLDISTSPIITLSHSAAAHFLSHVHNAARALGMKVEFK